MSDDSRVERTEREHRQYAEFIKENPGVSFAEFHAQKIVSRLREGHTFQQLGPNHRGKPGSVPFERALRWFPITPEDRVVDYGCGTFRIGRHYIEMLTAGNYFGLDVTDDLLEIGREMLGDDLLREKEPKIRPISEASVDDAVAFDADFVFSNSVASHVAQEETPFYFRNLERIAHKPGAILWFDATIADRPVRHRNSSASLEGYVAKLPALEFVEVKGGGKPEEIDGQEVLHATMIFRRPG